MGHTQVKIMSENEREHPIYLYSHYGSGGQILRDIAIAFESKPPMLKNYEYLARIIFSRMIRFDIEGHTNYGIGTHMHGDLDEFIVVDTASERVHIISEYSPTDMDDADSGDYSGCTSLSFNDFTTYFLEFEPKPKPPSNYAPKRIPFETQV